MTLVTHFDQTLSVWIQIAVFSVALFVGTMVCHGELVRAKPAARYLTGFYLAVAAGGAVGGVLVAVIAPRLFLGYWEYPLGLLATGLLAMICVRRRPPRTPAGAPRRSHGLFILGAEFVDRRRTFERSIRTNTHCVRMNLLQPKRRPGQKSDNRAGNGIIPATSCYNLQQAVFTAIFKTDVNPKKEPLLLANLRN